MIPNSMQARIFVACYFHARIELIIPARLPKSQVLYSLLMFIQVTKVPVTVHFINVHPGYQSPSYCTLY